MGSYVKAEEKIFCNDFYTQDDPINGEKNPNLKIIGDEMFSSGSLVADMRMMNRCKLKYIK